MTYSDAVGIADAAYSGSRGSAGSEIVNVLCALGVLQVNAPDDGDRATKKAMDALSRMFGHKSSVHMILGILEEANLKIVEK
jgi:hypothetical protein